MVTITSLFSVYFFFFIYFSSRKKTENIYFSVVLWFNFVLNCCLNSFKRFDYYRSVIELISRKKKNWNCKFIWTITWERKVNADNTILNIWLMRQRLTHKLYKGKKNSWEASSICLTISFTISFVQFWRMYFMIYVE